MDIGMGTLYGNVSSPDRHQVDSEGHWYNSRQGRYKSGSDEGPHIGRSMPHPDTIRKCGTDEPSQVQTLPCSISLTHTCWFKEGILKQQNFTGISLVVNMLKIEPLSPSPIIPLVGLCRIHTVLDSLRGLLVPLS